MRKYALYLERFLLYSVLVAMIISLAACVSSSPAPTTGSPTQAGSPPPVATVPVSPASSGTAPSTKPASPSAPVVPPIPSASVPPTAAAATPAIQIIAPTDFSSYHTAVIEPVLKIAVSVTNFKLVDKTGQPAASGEGHIIYYIDAEPPTAPGVSAVSPGGSYITTTATAIIWENLPKGAHKVAVQLVNNDNTPLSPPVLDRVQTYVSFVVGAPGIKISSPGIAATLPAGNITIQTTIHDFISTENMNKSNLQGEGHIVYYMDVDPVFDTDKPALTANGTYVNTGATSYTWQNVQPGVHTFSVQLVNNDSTSLSSPPSAFPAVDKIKVIVQ